MNPEAPVMIIFISTAVLSTAALVIWCGYDEGASKVKDTDIEAICLEAARKQIDCDVKYSGTRA